MTLRRRSRTSVALAAVSSTLIAVAVAATMPDKLATELRLAAVQISGSNHALLAVGAACFLIAPICTGLAWATALRAAGGELGAMDACARYGVGSLVNSVTPLRIGDFVRLALFARALPPGFTIRSLGALASLKLVRVAALLALAGMGLNDARLEVPAAGCVLIAVLLARTRRALGLIVLSSAATAARVGAVAFVLAALGIGASLARACAIVPALALASVLPLTPGNMGVASAAIAASLHLSGVGVGSGVAIGIVLHAVETAAGLSFGACSALTLAALHGRQPQTRRRRFVTKASPLRRPRLVG
jgi:uncharacterized membrane protein YbhN (UPF0104 family)